MRAAVALALLIATVVPRSAAAQSGQDNPALCWEPRPAPACRRTLITEFGVGASLSSTPVLYLTSELGVMKTTKSRGAVGASLFVGMLDDDGRLGVQARYRRWLGQRFVADVAAGPLLLNASFRAQHLGFIAQTSVGYRDWIGATLQLEVVSYEDRGTVATAFLGGRTGSYPGFGGNVLGALLFVIALTFSDPFDSTSS
jgi:hypothetical protein